MDINSQNVICLFLTMQIVVYESKVVIWRPQLPSITYLSVYIARNVSWCIQECNLRPRCKGVQFSHRQRVCHFLDDHHNATLPIKTTGGKLATYLKSMPTPLCGNISCSGNEMCNQDNGQCETKECADFDDSAGGITVGNAMQVGSRIKHTCKRGFIFPDGHNETSHVCSIQGNWTDYQHCIVATCDIIGRRTNVSNEYYTFDLINQQTFVIGCDFRQDHGYTFISPSVINNVTNISRYYSRTDHVMAYFITNYHRTFEGTIGLIQEYSGDKNITVILRNIHSDISVDSAVILESEFPSIQLVIPRTENGNPDVSGYSINGHPITVNISETRRRGFAVATGLDVELDIIYCNTGRGNYLSQCDWCEWINDSQLSLPRHFFYDNYFLMGGEDHYFYEINNYIELYGKVVGMTFGFRFDIT